MSSPLLSQAQGCLRLQSVYRAHRTRQCVTQRSRLEFERILSELEPESTRPCIVYPLAFMCRPQIERPSVAETVQGGTSNNHTSPSLSYASTPSSPAAPSVHTLHLSLDRSNAQAATCADCTASPSAAAPPSPSAQSFDRPVTFSAASAHVIQPEAAILTVSVGVGTVEDGSHDATMLLNMHDMQQHTQDRLKYSRDVAVQSIVASAALATSDACVGDDAPPTPTTSVHDSSSYCDDSFEEDGQDAGSSLSSTRSHDSCEASHLSVEIPPPPFSPEQHPVILHRWYSPSPSTTLIIVSRVAAIHPQNPHACASTCIQLPLPPKV